MLINDSSALNLHPKFEKSFFSVLLFAFTAIAVSVNYLLLFRNAFHGLDITDEGMYLLSVNHVTDGMSFHNPFGDYTGLLFNLSLGKVWLFRITGYLALGAAGAYLSTAISGFLPQDVSRSTKGSVILSGLLIGPFYYSLGILTPSYNWLNLLCLSIGLGAILNLQNSHSDNRFTSAIHIAALALAIWMGSFAKLSTGLGIFLLLLLSFPILRKPPRQIFKLVYLLFGFLALFAILHQLFISDLSVVLEQINRGQEALEILDPRYSISLVFESFKSGSLHWLGELIGGNFIWPLVTVGLLVFAYRYRYSNILQNQKLVSALAVLPIGSFLISARNGDWSGVAARYNDQMWAVTHILSVSLFLVFINSCLTKTFSFLAVVNSGLLLGGPVLYAFGSNNGFVEQITGATGIIGIASILLLTSIQQARGLMLSVTALVLSIGAVTTTVNSAQDPYRQAPLSQQSVLVEISRGGGRLYLEKNFAEDINSLRSQLNKSGWKSRTPLLDFTKYSAGIVYAVDALQPVTVMPTVGGMDGVNALAEWSFNYISENDEKGVWSSAWLLFPSEKNLKDCQLCPSTSVLEKLNRTFPDDYVLIATSKNFRIYKPRD